MNVLGWRVWWALAVLVVCLGTRRWGLFVVFALFYGVLFLRSRRRPGRVRPTLPGSTPSGSAPGQPWSSGGPVVEGREASRPDDVGGRAPTPDPTDPSAAHLPADCGPAENGVLQRLPEGEEDIRGVEVVSYVDGTLEVGFWVLLLVRDAPLEEDLRRVLERALSSVPGVGEVIGADRETYLVRGDPDPHALLAAAAAGVDSMAEQVAQHIIDQV